MSHRSKLENPSYCMELYGHLLKVYRKRDNPWDRISFPKIEKDILVVLLEKATPEVSRKLLRKNVNRDLKEITDEACQQID